MDARQRRSRAALHGAIIDLATERSVGSLTVGEVTKRAGVNRTTFYAHATTTAELLRDALRTELDVLREEFLDAVHRTELAPVDLTTAIRHVTLGVLDHIDAHSTLYLRAFGEADERPAANTAHAHPDDDAQTAGSADETAGATDEIEPTEPTRPDATADDSGLRTMLATHFEDTTQIVLRDHTLEIPDDLPLSETEHALFVATAPRFVAVGTVAAMELWLRTPAPRSRESFLHVFRCVLPSWWPLDVLTPSVR